MAHITRKPQVGSKYTTNTVAPGHGIAGSGAAEATNINYESTNKRVGDETNTKHASDPRDPLGDLAEKASAYDHEATANDLEADTAAEATGGTELVHIPAKRVS